MFFVLAYPRSLSYWVTCFLRTSGKRVEHEVSCDLSSLTDINKLEMDGIVDTGLGIFWNKLPEGKKVILLRDKEACEVSLQKAGFNVNINILWDTLKEAGKHYPVFYGDEIAEDIQKAKQFFEYLTEQPFDVDSWDRLRQVNIQRSIPEILRKVDRNMDNIKKLYQEVF